MSHDPLPTPARPKLTRRLQHFVYQFFTLRHDSDSNVVNGWERDYISDWDKDSNTLKYHFPRHRVY